MDTIAAVATSYGKSSVGIIRISGPEALLMAERLLRRSLQYVSSHTAFVSSLVDSDDQPIDEPLVVLFRAPKSFTGEDVVELQMHGNPLLLDWTLEQLVEHGVRLAEPGEFSQRAYLNGKLDLVQAEAIADLIEASSLEYARLAYRSFDGELSRPSIQLKEQLVQLRVLCEANIDFVDEEVDLISNDEISQRIQPIFEELTNFRAKVEQGKRFQGGLQVVIAGFPNAGKSTLLNAISGEEAAIVTSIPGTTRDLIKERIHLRGVPITLVDTAGIRETSDPVEIEGILRSRTAIEKADHLLWLSDLTDTEHEIPAFIRALDRIPVTIVQTKADLVDESMGTKDGEIRVSAKSGFGLDLLKNRLLEEAGLSQKAECQFLANQRHLDCLNAAYDELEQTQTLLESEATLELIAESLRCTHNHLGQLLGDYGTEDLLGDIFSRFCIGK